MNIMNKNRIIDLIEEEKRKDLASKHIQIIILDEIRAELAGMYEGQNREKP